MKSPICDISVLLSLLVIICMLRRILEIFPSLLASLIRWKESVNLFNSVKLSRSINMTALSMVVPFCLAASASRMYCPSFMESMGDDARFGITLGVFTLFIMLRMILERFCAPKRRNQQMYRCACRSSYIFFTLLTILLISLWGILSVMNVDANTSRDAMLWL